MALCTRVGSRRRAIDFARSRLISFICRRIRRASGPPSRRVRRGSRRRPSSRRSRRGRKRLGRLEPADPRGRLAQPEDPIVEPGEQVDHRAVLAAAGRECFLRMGMQHLRRSLTGRWRPRNPCMPSRTWRSAPSTSILTTPMPSSGRASSSKTRAAISCSRNGRRSGLSSGTTEAQSSASLLAINGSTPVWSESAVGTSWQPSNALTRISSWTSATHDGFGSKPIQRASLSMLFSFSSV